MNPILKLDAAGAPIKWIDYEKAAGYVAKGLVAWSLGPPMTLTGGRNKVGELSTMELPAIIAVKGRVTGYRTVPALTKPALLKRDRHTCAYCGGVFKACDLQMEHIFPEARGGLATWQNLVAACGGRTGCNAKKGCMTPEEAGMKLLYVPYVPNIFEGLILEGRRILADQHEFLWRGIPKHSRLLPL